MGTEHDVSPNKIYFFLSLSLFFFFFFGWKGKVALIRKPETWGEGRLMSQTNSEDSAWQ